MQSLAAEEAMQVWVAWAAPPAGLVAQAVVTVASIEHHSRYSRYRISRSNY